MKIETLVKNLRGVSTAIIFDDCYGVMSLLAELLKRIDDELFFVVFSDTICRRLKVYYNLIEKIDRDFYEILKNVKVIKIGEEEHAFNNNLYEILDLSEEGGWFDELINIFKHLPKHSVILFFGFDLIEKFFQDAWVDFYKNFWKMCEEDRTIILLYQKNFYKDFYSHIFDLVISLTKTEMGDMKSTRNYIVEIYRSIVPNLPPETIFIIRDREILEV